MRTHLLLGMLLWSAWALPAAAQSGLPGAKAQSGSPAFFTSPLGKPNFTAQSQKSAFLPATPNLTRMMPSWSKLQDTMLLRNFFSGPSMSATIYPAPTPPTPKKKFLWLP